MTRRVVSPKLVGRAGAPGQRLERRALARLDVPSGIRDPVLERVGRLPAGAPAARSGIGR